MNPARPAEDGSAAAPQPAPPPGTALSPQGLTGAEVADRMARGLVNRPPRSGWAEYRDIAVRNLFTLFNALVVPAAVVLFLLQDRRAAWAVSAMAVVNTLIGLVQEMRAKWHLDQLALLAEARARVVRDGTTGVIPQGEVVLDDRVLLAAGDPVVADGTILESRFLEVDEALLTGESDPVPRREGERLLSGSFCVAGEGAYRAEGVGAGAFAHRTAAEARRYSVSRSPLQRTIDLLIRVLTGLTVALCLGYGVLYFVRGFNLDDLVRMVAATVTSMVPQGLVLMTTLALTLGALRLSRRGAVVQRLPAVEAMAEVDVVCMDKTGTLTTSRLRLEKVVVLHGGPAEDAVRERLRRFAWASLDAGNKSIQALRTALGQQPHGDTVRVLDQVPFKSQNRCSAVRVRTEQGEETLALGAFEVLGGRLVPAETRRWETVWQDLLATGWRLLLFVRRDDTGEAAPLTDLIARTAFEPLGLVALGDELRADAGEVLKALAGQGLAFKVLSGDNPETVRATLAHVPLPAARQAVVTGDDWERAGAGVDFLREHAVFGRVSPRQKLAIVTALQREGHRVAMIGDGVNDLLPIKRADLGVAMGEGSGATRTVAGLVLENNSFELLPSALDEGRTILRNVRRAAKLFLLKNVYTLFLIVAALGICGLPFPYLPQQVTLLNSLTIGVPAFFIMLGRNPPGRPVHRGFIAEVGAFALGSGLATGMAGLGLWLDAAQRRETVVVQRTLLLSLLVLLGLVNVLRLILDREAEPESGDRGLKVWLGVALLLYLAAMYTGPVAYFFELAPLDGWQWGRVLAAWAAGLVLILAGGALARRVRRARTTGAD